LGWIGLVDQVDRRKTVQVMEHLKTMHEEIKASQEERKAEMKADREEIMERLEAKADYFYAIRF
jgi:hypothetical protein